MVALVPSILYHTALGMTLSLAVWAVGLAGLVRWNREQAFRFVVHAYPLGLLAVMLASLLLLIRPWLGAAAAAAVVVGGTGLLRERRRVSEAARRIASPILWAAPGILALPFALGLLLHGPTSKLDSHAFGDLVFYVARLQSANESVVPYRDLLVEGEHSSYVQIGSTLIGGLVAKVPGFDAFLFYTTTLPAFLLTSLCIGLAFTPRAGGDRSPAPAAGLLGVALLAVSVAAYPTWIAESPPVALALPLAFSVFSLWRESVPLGLLAVLGVALAADLLLTKMLAAIPLGALFVIALHRHYRVRITTRQALFALALVVTGAVLALAFVVLTSSWLVSSVGVKFLPADAVRGLHQQLTTRDTQAVAPALQVLGHLLLAAALVRSRAHALLAVLAVSLAANWLIGGHTIDIAPGVAVLLAALYFWTRPDLLGREWPLVLAAGASLASSAWFREVFGVQAGLTLALLLGATVLAALVRLTPAQPPANARPYAFLLGVTIAGVLLALSGRPFAGFALVAASAVLPALAGRLYPDGRRVALPLATALIVLAAGGVAALAATRDELRLSTQRTTLTTHDHDVWQRVRELVPPAGLVFTSLTGSDKVGGEGWNYYPGVAARQLYIGGWLYSSLSDSPVERRRRLALNNLVLAGNLAPKQVRVEDDYDAFFAVMRVHEREPRSFQLLDSNRLFAIYRIPA